MSSPSSSTLGFLFTYNKPNPSTDAHQVPAVRHSSIRYRTLTISMNKGVNTTISPMNSIINNKAKGCSSCGN